MSQLAAPAERYEALLERLKGSNEDLGEMQSIANELTQVGFDAAIDFVRFFIGRPDVADIMAKAPKFNTGEQ